VLSDVCYRVDDGTSGSMSLALRQYAAMVKSVICHRQDDAKEEMIERKSETAVVRLW
jgi:hypothetical protein